VARLIRSKGVGVFFVTQNPDDVPSDILGQLGNRIQHALRAYTPRDQKALRAAAETFRPNPNFDTETAIREVGTGEAVVSLLERKGVPSVVQRTLIRPPSSRLGPISDAERASLMAASPIAGLYESAIDRDSAFEELSRRAAKAQAEQAPEDTAVEADREFSTGRRYNPDAGTQPKTTTRTRRSDTPTEAFTKSLSRSVGTKLGTAIVRGVLGSLFRR